MEVCKHFPLTENCMNVYNHVFGSCGRPDAGTNSCEITINEKLNFATAARWHCWAAASSRLTERTFHLGHHFGNI